MRHGFESTSPAVSYAGFAKRPARLPRFNLPPTSSSKKDILSFVYEKEDLLVDHQGRDKDYNFYRYAGVATNYGDKGEHIGEREPVDIKSNMP